MTELSANLLKILLGVWSRILSFARELKGTKLRASKPSIFSLTPSQFAPYFLLTPGDLACPLACSVYPPGKWKGNICVNPIEAQ